MLAERVGHWPEQTIRMAQPRIGQKVVVDVPATANPPGFDCLGAALDEQPLCDAADRRKRREIRIDHRARRAVTCAAGRPSSIALLNGSEGRENGARRLGRRVRLAVPPARGSAAAHRHRRRTDGSHAVGEPLSKEKLLELAIDIEGHPDNVVPSLLGGLCMTAKAASQRWRVVRCEWINSVKAVVAIPSIRLSTSEARRAMPKSIPVSDAVVNLGALTLLLQGLRTGNGDLIADGMHDRLHEPYRWRLIKGGDEVKAAALEAGAWGCAISGAGPSIIALCTEDKGLAVSRAMVRAWESAGVASRAPVLNLQTSGSHWQPAEPG